MRGWRKRLLPKGQAFNQSFPRWQGRKEQGLKIFIKQRGKNKTMRGWRNWQTRKIQDLVGKPRAGSNPAPRIYNGVL